MVLALAPGATSGRPAVMAADLAEGVAHPAGVGPLAAEAVPQTTTLGPTTAQAMRATVAGTIVIRSSSCGK